ncbi:MAG: TRAP transporter substrate-binding protein, partial [Alphaproteobacteria bacterium]|nr:TRAP transporter substrate-binding protein [Alphaproteobacteria bacterium]
FQFVPSEQDALQQVVRGRLQVGILSTIALASVIPEAAVFVTPYLWASPAEADWVIDNHARAPLAALADAKGLVLIGLTETGWTDVVGKSPFLAPADVKGRKIRVSPAPASQFFWSSLGANGVQLPLGELFPGLEQGLVEGADLPFVYYITTPAAKSAPHYTLTRHTHIFNGVVANKAAWGKLTPAQQEAIMKGVPAYPELRKEVRAAEQPLMAKFESEGGKVHPLTDAQRKAWYDIVAPGQRAYVEKMGPGAVQLFETLQKGRKAYAERRQ